MLGLLAAAGVTIGTILVLRSPDGRVVSLGLALALVLAPLTSEPLPGILSLAYRIVAALLSAYLVWLAVRTTTPYVGTPRLGGTAEAVFVAAAFLLGLMLGVQDRDPAVASLAGGLACGAGALAMLAFGRDPLRIGCGAVLGLLAASLGQSWLTGTAADLGQLAFASAILAAAAATAWLCIITFRICGDLDLEPRGREIRDLR
jgi:hypothetical protein